MTSFAPLLLLVFMPLFGGRADVSMEAQGQDAWLEDVAREAGGDPSFASATFGATGAEQEPPLVLELLEGSDSDDEAEHAPSGEPPRVSAPGERTAEAPSRVEARALRHADPVGAHAPRGPPTA